MRDAIRALVNIVEGTIGCSLVDALLDLVASACLVGFVITITLLYLSHTEKRT